MTEQEYKPGELFVYTNGDRWELGQVKGISGEGRYSCWYSTGDTAELTAVEDMHKLENAGWSHIERKDNTTEKVIEGKTTLYTTCGGCLEEIDPMDNYCRHCGRRLIG